jgi:tetratricopeptide (TPR) repeat protein
VIAKATLPAAMLLVLLVTSIVAQQRLWYQLYDEAVQHVRRSEWTLAETKLKQAQKEGPAPGRTVLRYGMLRAAYFPDFYLGVVYLNTNRPKEAIQAFQQARSQKLNVQDREFVTIADYEARAQRDAQRLAAADTTPAPPPLKPIEKPAPPTGDPVPTVPVPTAPVPDPGAERKRLETQFDQALQSRNLPTARQVLGELQKAATDPKVVAGYSARVNSLDREIRLTSSERTAMRAFFAGNYQQAVSAINAVETELGGAPVSPRGYFYRACALAAQALRAQQVDSKALIEARRQYAEAMKSRQVLAPDRRYVSPRILQALGS